MTGDRKPVYVLTGVTGFLGKVVLEALLRRRDELGLERVVVLIRPRRRRSPEERFRHEVAASECFRDLPEDWTEEVEVLPGELDRPGLGLDREAWNRLAGGATHLLHAAASVDFRRPMAAAVRSNVTATLNVLELARSCEGLRKLVYVSTAYVTPRPVDGLPVDGALPPLPRPAHEIYRAVRDGRLDGGALLAESGHPNTYTLTKALAEHLLLAEGDGLPLAIVRPSIISATWRRPFPGWIDSPAGFAAFVGALGSGRMRALIGDPEARLDLVPVDEVADRILLACDDAGRRGPAIRHVVAGPERSLTVQECWEVIRDFFSAHRVGRSPRLAYLGPPGWRFRVADLVHHRIVPVVARLGPTDRERRKGPAPDQVARLNDDFPYFTTHSFSFPSSEPLDPSFDPRGYVATVCRGVYRHLLGGSTPTG